MYPQPSNFRLGGTATDPKAWWFLHTPFDGRLLCQTTGWAFITLVQRTLRNELLASIRGTGGSLIPTYDGTFNPSVITEDGQIGPNTLRGLWTWIKSQHVLDALLEPIRQDAQVRVIRRDTVIAMIYFLLHHSMAQGGQRVKLSQIELPVDAVLPLFGSAPARTQSFLSVCTALAEPMPGDPTEPPRPPPPPPSDEVAPPTPPVAPTARPPGPVTLPPAPQESTISPTVAIAGVLVVLALAAVAYTSTRPSKGEKATKRRRRSK